MKLAILVITKKFLIMFTVVIKFGDEKMTSEELNVAIVEIIIPQEKPKRKQNSYFRKIGDKNKLNKLIPLERLKNVESDFYKRFLQWRRFRMANENYMFISGINLLVGVRYSSFTGRLKKFSDCKPRKY